MSSFPAVLKLSKYIGVAYLIKNQNSVKVTAVLINKFPQKKTRIMLNKYFRIIAGTMVLLSVVLTVYVNPNWIWFTVFIGVNLIQSAFTKWCLLETILMKLGVKKEAASCAVPSSKG
jgi:hypothetical protein